MVSLHVIGAGHVSELCRPCVDCGQITGNFCDGNVHINGIFCGRPDLSCWAADRVPDEVWVRGQYTPLCPKCDSLYEQCHFCRKLSWCRPAEWRDLLL